MQRSLFLLILLFICSLASAQLSDNIKVATHEFSPDPNLENYLNNAAQKTTSVEGRYYRLVQFTALPDLETIHDMESRGLRLLSYIPDKTYYVSIASNFDPQQLRNFGVRYIDVIPQLMKVDEDILAGAHPQWATVGNKLELSMTYPEDIREATVLTALEEIGVEAKEYNGYNSQMLIHVPTAALDDLMALPFLLRLDYGPEPSIPDDARGKGLAKANLLDSRLPTGRSYNGKGVSVMTRDDGHVGPHIDFQGRLNQTLSPNSLIHADNVSGVMCGAANYDPNIPGMATAADLYVINYRASFLDNTMDFHFNEDVLVTNSSYSNGCNRGYTIITQTVDQQCYDNPTLMHVFSAGNSNGESCGYGAGDQWGNITGGHKVGKNVIAVGSTDYRGVISGFSSRGPAHDGRIKPDLTALGQAHTTTLPNNNYNSTSGTSFSAPLVAGVMGMLHQAYADNNDGEVAEAALLKTLMLNTADDLGQPGPDFIFGWGNVNAYKSALAIEEKRYEKVSINAGDSNTHSIEIPAGTAEVKVMVYWADQPGLTNTAFALVNDLDCTLRATNGEEYLPYILDTSPDASLLNMPATRGIDRLNNVEQISIKNPEAGTYELKVAGTILPFGVHEYFYTWEYFTDDIVITYPTEGELLAPRDVMTAHWDAIDTDQTFTMEISTDNGATWMPLGGASLRKNKDISLPNVITDQARVKVIRNGVEVISDQFTIAPEPSNLDIERICFDILDLTWDPIDEAVSYDIYRLGDRYMVYEVTVTDTFAELQIVNSFDEHYFAVSANYDGGIRSQRSIAIGTTAEGLVNCKMDMDLAFDSLQLSNNGNYIVCEGPITEFPVVTIENTGLEALTQFELSYSVNGSTAVTENININLLPDSTYTHTFSEPFILTDNGDVDIVTWLSRDGELLIQNDTLTFASQSYFDAGEALPFSEDFNAQERLPSFWNTESPVDEATWGIVSAIQRDGRRDNVCVMPFADAGERETTDILSSIPLDFTTAGSGTLALSFDKAYFYEDREDGLIVRILSECGTEVLDTLFEQSGAGLATSSSFFDLPNEVYNWSSESIDLSSYQQLDKAIIQFIGFNDRGNNLYIDNINVTSINLTAPEANFSVAGDGSCILEELVVEDNSTGGLLTYNWDFGLGGIPRTATGPGPHNFSYFIPGEKNIVLTVTNSEGTETLVEEVIIEDVPSGRWDFTEIGSATLQFDADFSNVTEYFWEFGDGSISTESDPRHQYPGPGTYEISLLVRNGCGQRTFVNGITVLTSSVDNVEDGNWSLAPNPTKNIVTLFTNEVTPEAHIQLINLAAEKVWERNMRVDDKAELNLGGLPAGIYTVLITADNKRQSLRLVKI